MLFMITQVHTPETCPKDEGGADVLIDKGFHGVTVKGRWGAWSQHTVWYLVEADSADAIQKFLDPGMKRCHAHVVPVAAQPLTRPAAAPRRSVARR
ncbi:MAG: DUF3303 family protein [Chloroflexi bacterium]|nr:DUF3303 family protein [Chloroflexota bacterium]